MLRLRACGHTVTTLVILGRSRIKPLRMELRLKSAPAEMGALHSVTSLVKKLVRAL